MSKMSQIFEGWKNHISPEAYLLEQITKAHTERMAICSTCPFNSLIDKHANPLRWDEHCTKCGCTLSAKTKCLSCSCPINKWESIMTSEEEEKTKDSEEPRV